MRWKLPPRRSRGGSSTPSPAVWQRSPHPPPSQPSNRPEPVSSSSDPRLFTLDEANALIPVIAPLLEVLQQQLQELRTKHQAAQRLAEAPKSGNGHRLQEETEVRQAKDEVERLSQQFQRAMEHLQSYGCEIKDVDTGLLDFRGMRDGEVVYLCWRAGETAITHWHALDSGFAGRQPL
ncbi:MAG: DUF2203 family protein [Dehalococcoidia bacterium]|nr:DUF2203 family protein [Dehalococcoidia bacterium]